MLIYWNCPGCGNENRDDINHAALNTCICKTCGAECEITFILEVTDVNVL